MKFYAKQTMIVSRQLSAAQGIRVSILEPVSTEIKLRWTFVTITLNVSVDVVLVASVTIFSSVILNARRTQIA